MWFQVALNHINTIECLEETMTMILEKIAKCQFYTSIYVGVQMPTNNSNLHTRANSALPQFYAAVIVFAMKSQDYFTTRCKWELKANPDDANPARVKKHGKDFDAV